MDNIDLLGIVVIENDLNILCLFENLAKGVIIKIILNRNCVSYIKFCCFY